jgi:hypothetical protein
MRKYFPFILFAVLAVTACNTGPQAPFDKDDEIVIHGAYQDPAGNPYAQRWVGFWINSPESFFTNFLGLDPESNDRTDSAGAYAQNFMGADLMDAGGATYQIIVMHYDPDWPDTTATVAALFFPLDTIIEVPTMKLWRGGPSTVLQNYNATFTWQKISRTHGSEPNAYTFQVKASQDGPSYTMWQQAMGGDTTLTLPAYILPNNYAKKWRVLADFPAPDQSSTGYVYITDPDTTPITGQQYQLLSLGRNCYAESYAQTFPTATDGKWGPWPTYCVAFVANNVSWIFVDLGDSTHDVNAVALYDLNVSATPTVPGFEIYISDDTLNWGAPTAENNQQRGYFYIDGFTQPGRYVKVQAKDDVIGISGFREICVFGQ